MTRLWRLLVLVALLAQSARGDFSPGSGPPSDLTASGTITTTCSTPTAACPAGSFVALSTQGISSVNVLIGGTFTGASLNVDSTVDGTTWNVLQTADGGANPSYSNTAFTTAGKKRIFRGAGFQQLRVRASALTSGSVTVAFDASSSPDVVEAIQLNPANFQLTSSPSDNATKATYTAVFSDIAIAALPTDILCLTGSATKTVRLLRFHMGGSTSSGGLSVFVQVIKRSSVDTGGTSTALTLTPHDSNNAGATASAVSYSTNPTALGTIVGALCADRFTVTSVQNAGTSVDCTFGSEEPGQAAVLRGTAEQICINLSATTILGSSLSGYFRITEE